MPESAPGSHRRTRLNARQRRHSRIEIAAPLLIRITPGGGETFDGFCENLSVGGMFITALKVVPMGSKITVDMKLPTGKAITITGKVMWTTERGMGLQHDLLGARDTILLTEYLKGLTVAGARESG